MVEATGPDVDAGRGWSVRRAVDGDAEALADLRWRWRTHESHEIGMGRPEFLVAFIRWLHDHHQTHTAFVADAGTSGVGMAWLAAVERVPGPGVWRRLAGNLQSVYVLPGERGRGIGAALVAATLHEAVGRGFDYVSVHPSEQSFPLYRRLGFHENSGVLEIDLRSRAPAPAFPVIRPGWPN